jgi:hypothetical protein
MKSALSLFKQSQRLFSSLSTFESVPPRPQLRRLAASARLNQSPRGRNYAGCARLPPLGAGELGALPVGSAGWALAGGWEAPAGGRQGGRGDPGGGKGRLNFLYSAERDVHRPRGQEPAPRDVRNAAVCRRGVPDDLWAELS